MSALVQVGRFVGELGARLEAVLHEHVLVELAQLGERLLVAVVVQVGAEHHVLVRVEHERILVLDAREQARETRSNIQKSFPTHTQIKLSE